MSSKKIFDDFEFERRFFCESVDKSYFEGARQLLIVQSYFLSDEGYSIRVRLQTKEANLGMNSSLQVHDVINKYQDSFDYAFCTLKGPAVGGTRYESEMEIDVNIALEMSRRNAKSTLVKNRSYVWIDEDGWVIDTFGGENYPLIIAECERSTPVVNLKIPTFCTSEITDEKRFGNDSLVNIPFGRWESEFREELKTQGARFSDAFGENRFDQK